MFEVFKKSPGGIIKEVVDTFENEEDASEYCGRHNWEMVDENRFAWNLDYRKV